MRERFRAKDERSWKLRFHTQTAGVSLTAQQPYNNVVRTALQALVGGARRHELAAHQLARRGAGAADRGGRDARPAHAADHRARERRRRTSSIRSAGRTSSRSSRPTWSARRYAYFEHDRPDGRHGGRHRARATRRRRSPRAPTASSRRVERGEKIIVGVNGHVARTSRRADPLHRRGRRRAAARTAAAAPARRDAASRSAARARRAEARAADGRSNTMPPIIDAVRAYATLGEMCDALREVWGEWTEEAGDLRLQTAGCRLQAAVWSRLAPSFSSAARSLESGARSPACPRSASSSPSPVSTATTVAPRSSRARCGTPGWKSSTPACARRPSRS